MTASSSPSSAGRRSVRGVPGAPWALFDLDGTLFDYGAAETSAVRATLTDVGVAATPAVLDDYREVNARHWAALERGETTAARLRLERWQEVLTRHGAPEVDPEVVAARYLGHLAAGSQLVPGAVEVVATVAASHRVAFVTNGLADVQRPRLAASPLAGVPEVVVISDEVGAAKPDPAIFDAAFDRMGRPEREAVTMIGDSLTADVAGGRAYGLATVWLAEPQHPGPTALAQRPTHRIASLEELPSLLRA